MKLSNEYNTKQKEKLIAFLIKNKNRHTNVQEISSYLAEEGSPVGTATIYRHLDRLVEQGVVRRYVFDGKSGACYQYIGEDGSCHEHFHLKCVSCGTLTHLDCDFLSGVNRHIYEHHGFTVNTSQTVFYGICPSCSGSEAK